MLKDESCYRFCSLCLAVHKFRVDGDVGNLQDDVDLLGLQGLGHLLLRPDTAHYGNKNVVW